MTYLPRSLARSWDEERLTADTDPALKAMEAQRQAAMMQPIPVDPVVEENTPANWAGTVPTPEQLGIAPVAQPQQQQNRVPTMDELMTGGGTPGVSMPTGAPGSASVPSGGGTGVSGGPVDHSSREAFIASMLPYAKQAEARTGIPAEIMMAINLNEQGWQSPAPGNNYFGIKGSNPRTGANTGPVNTWEDYGNGRQNIQDTFRAYDSPAESYADFGQFLKDNSRYHGALAEFQRTGDAAGLIRGIHAAGYATDPDWSNNILSIASTIPRQPQGSLAMMADNAPDHFVDVNKMVPSGTIKGVPVDEAMAMGGQFQLGGPDDGSGANSWTTTDTQDNQGLGSGASGGPTYPDTVWGGGGVPTRDNAWATGDLGTQPTNVAGYGGTDNGGSNTGYAPEAPVASGSTWQDTMEQPDWSASPPSGAQADPGDGAAPSPSPVEQPQDIGSKLRQAAQSFGDTLASIFGGGDQNTAPETPQRPATPGNFNLPAAESRAQNAASTAGLESTLPAMEAANAGFAQARQAPIDFANTMREEQDASTARQRELFPKMLDGTITPDEESELTMLMGKDAMNTFAGGLETTGGKVARTAGRTVPDMASGVVIGADNAPPMDTFIPRTPPGRGSGAAVDEAMARMGTNALQGGVAGAVGEAQNDPNATPQSVLKATLLGGTQRVLLGNARGVLGSRNAGTIARAVKDATNRYANSGSPELERLGAMRNTPPPTVGDMPQAAGRAQQLARNLAQKLTDSNATMDNLQKDVLKAPLPIEDKVSALQRLNPESAVDMQIQREIMGPLREAGLEGRKDAADIMALEQNIVQAENIGRRVERDFRLPTVERRAQELADLQAEAAKLQQQGADVSVDLTSRIERAQAAVDEAKAYIEPAEAKAKADKLRDGADSTAQKAADQFNSPARVRVESDVQRLEAQAARETRAQGAPNESTFNALEDARGRLATEQQAEDVARQQIAETERLRVEEQARRLEDQYASPRVAKAQDRLDNEMARADQEIRRQGRMSATAERRVQAAQKALDDERQAEQVAAQQAGQTARDRRAFSGGLNAADSQKALADLEQFLGPERYASARKLAQSIWDFNDGTLGIKEAAHIVPSETAAALRETNAVYSPTNIIKYGSADSASGGVPIGKRIGLSDNGLKRLSEEGTTAAKQDDIEASIAARYDAMRMAHKNEITGKFLEASQANPELGQHVREIITREQWQQQGRQLLDGQVLDPGRLETGQTRIGWFDEKAIKHEYLVDDWAKTLVDGARTPDMTAYEKFLQEWKGSVTDRSLSFTMRNAPRDFIGVTRNMLVNEGGVYPKQIKQVIVDLANGYRDAFKGIRDGTFHGSTADYLESGGGYQRSSGRGLEGERQRVDDIARTGGLEIKNPLDFYHWYTDPLSELNKRLELGPRSARFRQEMRRSGGNDVQSVIAARDLMAYEVAGDWTRTMNRWIPFLSARVAGSMSDIRLARTNPKAYLAASIMTGVIPAFAQELYNRADPERSKVYDDVPPYLKYMGNVIMLPWAGKDTYGMPLPNYLFLPTGVVTPWAILGHGLGDAVMGKNAAPSDYAEALDGLIGSMAPVDTAVGGVASNILGPVGSGVVGMATNKDLFRGSEISTRQSDIEASRLSQLGAQGANALLNKVPVVGPGMANQSPAMWDYQIKNALGYPGQAILGASDTGRDRPGDASNVQDLPVIGGLVSPLVGNRSGGVFTQESGRIMSGRAGQEIRDSGVKWEPQPVDAKIGNVPLTRTERGEVQRDANKLFNEYAADVRRMDPKWDQYDAKTREGLLKNLYKSATQGAEAQLLQRYPERFGKDAIKSQERRIEIVQEKKAG